MDCSLPGSSIHGIFQARVLEWGVIAFSISTVSDPQFPSRNSQSRKLGPNQSVTCKQEGYWKEEFPHHPHRGMEAADSTTILKVIYAMCLVISSSLWPPWTVTCQDPLSTEFSRQEYWSGLPFPTPGNLPCEWSNQSLLDLLHCRWILYLPNHQRNPKVRWSSKSDGPNRRRIIRPGGSWVSTPMTPKEPRMTLDIGRKPVKFLVNLVNTGATYLVMNNRSDKLSQELWAIRKQIRWTHSHSFLPICSLMPYTPARRNILYTLEANIHLLGDKLKIGVPLDMWHKMIMLMAEDKPPRTKQVDLTGVNPKVWV